MGRRDGLPVVNEQQDHTHGSVLPPPRSKGEYVKHLRDTHGDARVNERMWTLAALKEEHAGSHTRGLT